MIAHRARDKQQSDSSFRRLVNYILDNQEAGKVESYAITNCSFDDTQAALKEIEATQAKNTRTKRDKSYHLVVSFVPGEKPDKETLKDIEQTLCEAIGFKDHQRISATHDDKDHYHLHVAINKIHPRTHNIIEPYYDKYTLLDNCQALEQKHGLIKQIDWDAEQTNRNSKHSKASAKARDSESHSGIKSFQSWAIEHRDEIKEKLDKAENWQEAHKALANYDIHLTPVGNGMNLGSRSNKGTMKASAFARAYSKAKCEKRWGEYEPPAEDIKSTVPELAYKGQPLAGNSSLWDEFQKAKEEKTLAQRQYRAERKPVMDQLYAHKKAQLQKIRNSGFNSALKQNTRFKFLQNWNAEKQKADRYWQEQQEKLNKEHPYSTNWQDFLIEKAQEGNADAIKTLRKGKRKSGKHESFTISPSVFQDTASINKRFNPEVKPSGDVIYTINPKNKYARVRATKDGLHTDARDDQTLSAFLQLSIHHHGKLLKIGGDNQELKDKLVRIAAKQDLAVEFEDAGLEKKRKELHQLLHGKQPKTQKNNNKGKER